MPGFEAIIGQTRPIRTLTRLLARGILPHALLFTGAEGVGKKTTAAALVQACNCLKSVSSEAAVRAGGEPRATACGECSACRKLAAGSHPDLRQLSPERGMIKIDPIRELCAFLAMKPYEARTRAVIIVDAQRMNAAAGSALLKMLEEPPPHTVMILTTAQPADLMPTILSRCRQIHFAPLKRRDLTEILVRDHGHDPAQADLAAALAGGSVTRALALLDERQQRRRAWLMQQLSDLPGQSPLASMALAEKLARDRGELPGDLDLIATWLRDMAIARDCPERVIHQNFLGSLTEAAQRLPEEGLTAAVTALKEAHRRVRANANPRLTLEALLFYLAARFSPAG